MADQTNGIGTQTAIDRLEDQQTNYLEQQQKINDQIIDTGLQKTQSQIDFEKSQYEQEAQKNAKALYTNYQKEQNAYGANAETIASQGLANSGYAESSRVNLYNNYQSNVTSLMNEMNREKAVLDQQMNQAYFDADIQRAQNMANIYQQKMTMAMNTYQLRYSLYRDQVADEQWAQQFELQKRQLELSQANEDRDYQLRLMQLQSSGRSGKSSKASTTSDEDLMDWYNQTYGNGAVAEAQNTTSANTQTNAVVKEQQEKNEFWNKAGAILTGLDVLANNTKNLETAGKYLLKAFKDSKK